GLPQGTGRVNPFASPADADKSFRWLDRVHSLMALDKKDAPLPVRTKLTLATAFKTKPDPARARELVEGVLKDPNQDRSWGSIFPLLLVKARVQDTPAQQLAAYHDILRKAKKKDRDEVPPLEWYATVLEPALAAGQEATAGGAPSAEVKAGLAKTYAALGGLLRDNLYVKWPF